MAQTIATQLDVILNDFERSSPHIQASAVVSNDGLVIASRLPAEVEEDRIGAMGAAILSISKRSGGELARGEIVRVLIEGVDGYILIRNVGDSAILVVLVEKKVRLGLLFLEANKCIKELSEVL
jgi:predicted regulator of Ras-like GTPase activity (Roadblock/LC7/MglB family)